MAFPQPVFILDMSDTGLPSASLPILVPIKIATNIPVSAPPAIKPELNNAPGPISESSFFLLNLSAISLINPPIKMGEVVERGR